MKIFLDSNILIAACGSQTGGSAYLFYVAEQNPSWHLLTSLLALQEAKRNVQKKLSKSNHILTKLILHHSLTVVNTPPLTLIKLAQTVITEKDAPILAAALMSQSDYFCTLDQKHFHTKKVKQWSKRYNLGIVTPGDLLVAWRDSKK